jgi:hypothetical protein
MCDLEEKISKWRKQMLAAGIKTPVPLEELEIHLREDIEQQTKLGLNEQEAFKASVLKIGQAHTVQNEFNKIETTREMIHLTLTTLGIVLILVGIPFLLGLGFALMLIPGLDGLLQQGRRKYALFLFLWWTATAVLILFCHLQDGTLAHVFVRQSLPLWYRAVFVCIWLGCISGHFWQRRKNKGLTRGPT